MTTESPGSHSARTRFTNACKNTSMQENKKGFVFIQNYLNQNAMQEIRKETNSSSWRRVSKNSRLVCFSAPGVLRTLLSSAILMVVLFNSSCYNKHALKHITYNGVTYILLRQSKSPN